MAGASVGRGKFTVDSSTAVERCSLNFLGLPEQAPTADS